MTTTFDCVQDWYDDGILQPVPDGDNYSARLRVAEDVIDDACSEDIEEFDCHDLISIVSDHYSVSIEDLLSYYDTTTLQRLHRAVNRVQLNLLLQRETRECYEILHRTYEERTIYTW